METARRLVRIALATWGLDDLADDGALIVSELATNAIQHTACCSITVSVDRFGPASVRIAVVDTSKLMPRRRAPGDTESRGRGLLLVEELATGGAPTACLGASASGESCAGRGLMTTTRCCRCGKPSDRIVRRSTGSALRGDHVVCGLDVAEVVVTYATGMSAASLPLRSAEPDEDTLTRVVVGLRLSIIREESDELYDDLNTVLDPRAARSAGSRRSPCDH
ncbi:ATP-binding protein [Streptomyces sp. M19]